jgi:hypothetical protein
VFSIAQYQGYVMQLHVTSQRVLWKNGHLVVVSAATFICISLLTSCVGANSDPNGGMSLCNDRSAADANDVVKDANGPTILLGYSEEDIKTNPIASFMYFVPLISPTLVDRETSANNEQQTGIISYERKVTSRSFYVACEFKVLGNGFHMSKLDLGGTVKAHTAELKKKESLAHVLDYIKLEGEGFGRIEVKGTIDGTTETVTEVSIQFNARGHKSPVTVGLYDIEPKNGKYSYENRSNQIVARVNLLTFKRTEKTPYMGIKVASITGAEESEGFFSGLRGSIANLFIKPSKVATLGNDTMLNFGSVLLKQEPAFTFPKARNIREDKRVAIDNQRNIKT